MAILNTIITSQPCDICSILQAAEEISDRAKHVIQPQYIYVLIREDRLDVTYPFPHGGSPHSGQKFVVKNTKYFSFLSHWKEVHLHNKDWNKKKKKVKRRKRK